MKLKNMAKTAAVTMFVLVSELAITCVVVVVVLLTHNQDDTCLRII